MDNYRLLLILFGAGMVCFYVVAVVMAEEAARAYRAMEKLIEKFGGDTDGKNQGD